MFVYSCVLTRREADKVAAVVVAQLPLAQLQGRGANSPYPEIAPSQQIRCGAAPVLGGQMALALTETVRRGPLKTNDALTQVHANKQCITQDVLFRGT